MNTNIQLTLTPKQLQTAGAMLNHLPGILSAFVQSSSTPQRLTHPQLVSQSGSLLDSVIPALQTLLDPWANFRITCLTPRVLYDLVTFYPDDPEKLPTVMLNQGEDEQMLTSPAPLAQIMADLVGFLSPFEQTAPDFSMDLSLATGWALFGVLDVLRNEANLQSLTAEQVLEKQRAPMESLSTLAAYFREKLDLAETTRGECLQALQNLAAQGLLQSDGNTFHPLPVLALLAQDLGNLRAFVNLVYKTHASGMVLQQEQTFLQGQSGGGLLWYEAEGMIGLHYITGYQMMDLVEDLLVAQYAES